jgi:hypothetical protein
VLAGLRAEAPVEGAIAAYAELHREQLDVLAGLIGDLKAAPQPTLPAILVVLRELGRLTRPRG